MFMIKHRSTGLNQRITLNNRASFKWIRVKLLHNENPRIRHNIVAKIIFDAIIFSAVDRKAICAPWNLYRIEYEILDVTGPDEYHERVHNNAFTNRLVMNTLEVCQKVMSYLQQNSSDFFKGLMTTLDFKSDLTLITDIASNLYLPDSNPTEA
jgi:Glycosyl hydrolase family 65 central catalytic domain